MYGDFSRVLDPRSGHYSAVLAQQGRLLLDAELNEQAAIVLDYLRRLTTDLVGPFAGPAHRPGFRVELVVEGGKCRAVRLSSGHYYVYGVRCDAPAPHQAPGDEIPVGEHEAPFVVYLAVWEQSVSAIQAPDLAEPALGPNLDTTRRSQVRWRPRAARYLPGSDVDLTELDREEIVEAFEQHNASLERRPKLGARAHLSPPTGHTPSTVPATAAYRGAENQLYRVEVHRGGDADDATFKWSRDNGSVEFGVESLTEIDGEGVRTARLSALWRDAHKDLEVGDWVELIDDHWAPFGRPPALMQVRSVSLHTREVSLEDADTERAFDPALHPLLRRWDNHDGGATPNHGIAVSDAMGRWLSLEDGVQVQFHDPEALYERGDFWLIPARTATGGVLWPHASDDNHAPLALPPHGPSRHLAPLALARSLSAEPTTCGCGSLATWASTRSKTTTTTNGRPPMPTRQRSGPFRSSIGCARSPRWPRASRSTCSRATRPSAGSPRQTSSSSTPTSRATTPPSPPRAAVSPSGISSRRTGPGSTIAASLPTSRPSWRPTTSSPSGRRRRG